MDTVEKEDERVRRMSFSVITGAHDKARWSSFDETEACMIQASEHCLIIVVDPSVKSVYSLRSTSTSTVLLIRHYWQSSSCRLSMSLCSDSLSTDESAHH